MNTNGILLAAIVFFAINNSAKAQSTLDQSNTGSSSTRSLVDNIQTCIQTFTAGYTDSLIQVKVDIETENCPYPLLCEILDGGATGNVIASELVNIPINTPRNMYAFTFSMPPPLVSGNVYAIALYANCVSGPGQSIWWYKSVNNAYVNGQAYNRSGTNVQPEDTLNDFYFQTFIPNITGLYENTGDKPVVFPNPASSYLTIETPEKATIEITCIEGQIQKTIKSETKQTTVNVSDLSSGVYILKVKTEKGVAIRKFIKK